MVFQDVLRLALWREFRLGVDNEVVFDSGSWCLHLVETIVSVWIMVRSCEGPIGVRVNTR